MPSKSSSSSGSCASHVAQFLVAVLALVGALNAFVTQPTLLHHTDAFPPAQWRGKYGPWAVVAGASKGLGREWVVQCAARGLNVVAIARNAKELELTKAEALKANASVKIELVAMDLANSEAVLEYSTKLAKEREVGLLIYNAAMGAPGEFLSQAFKYHKLTFDVNVYSMLAMVHSFAAPMVARKHGGIVIVGSMAGELGNAWVSTYGGTKSLQRNFVEALWWELKRYGVDVLLPLLGPTTTDALQVMKEDMRKQRLMEQSPEEVVTETMHALGRGVPTLSTGLFGKFSWILLRYVPVPWMAEIANGNMVDVYRSQEELDAITKKGASGPTSG